MPVDPNVKYVVTSKGHVGPFPPLNSAGLPTVFSRQQFADLHADVPKGTDADKYHDGLIRRLVQNGAIQQLNLPAVTVDRKPDPLPLGPEVLAAKEAAEKKAEADAKAAADAAKAEADAKAKVTAEAAAKAAADAEAKKKPA